MTAVYKVRSVEETWAVAKDFAKGLRPGDVVCLEGDLGAGKTTFTQGLVAALGASGRVTSPTFCLVQEHGTVVHMDLYRLKSEEDVLAIGWEDYLAAGAILVVEWPERAGSLIPSTARRVKITIPEPDTDFREIAISHLTNGEDFDIICDNYVGDSI